ncbi:MAG: methylmalonyl-CoA mutase, partial [Gemmatimonadetes bacterium]|nr:methylmalonyl-CoA mutase [Gemmatimonadota bacterium]
PVALPDFTNLQRAQRSRLEEVRRARDSHQVELALGRVATAAGAGSNLLPAMIEAVKVRASLGEISGRLLGLWGPYRPQ